MDTAGSGKHPGTGHLPEQPTAGWKQKLLEAVDCGCGLSMCLEGFAQPTITKTSPVVPNVRHVAGPGRGARTEDEFQRRIEFLGKVPLFRCLARSHYPILARELRGVCWRQNQVVVEAGAQIAEFMLVAEGWAEVQVFSKYGGPPTVRRLRPGDYFGERVLQTGGGVEVLCPARIVAGQGLTTLAMGPGEFEQFGLRDQLQFPRRRALSRCVLADRPQPQAGSKSEAERKFIADALKRNQNLRSLVDLKEDVIKKMVDAAEKQEVVAGTQVVQQGAYGGLFFIVESGCFELRHNTQTGNASQPVGDILVRALHAAKEAVEKDEDQFANMQSSPSRTPHRNKDGSETQRRRLRKEKFLQKLAHTRDFETVAASPSRNSYCMSPSKTRGGLTSPSGSAGDRSARHGAGSDEDCASLPRCKSSPISPFSTGGQEEFPHLLPSPGVSPTAAKTANAPDTGREPSGSIEQGQRLSEKSNMSSKISLPMAAISTGRTSTSRGSGIAGAGRASVQSILPRTEDEAESEEGDHVLGIRRPGDCFGELALLFHAPRTSDAIAIEDSVAWTVSQSEFRRIMSNLQKSRAATLAGYLDEVDLLQGLLTEEKADLAQNLMTAKYKKGDWLIKEGEEQQAWNIVVRGEVMMSRRKEGDWEKEEQEEEDEEENSYEELGVLVWPNHFGERALLRKQASDFAVQAISDEVECLILDGPTFLQLAAHLSPEDFQRAQQDDLVQFAKFKQGALDEPARFPSQDATTGFGHGFLSRLRGLPLGLGPLAMSPVSSNVTSTTSGGMAMTSTTSSISAMNQTRKGKHQVSRGPAQLDGERILNSGEEGFKTIGVLGRGGFGVVTLEHDPITGQRYAMKKVSKRHIVAQDLQKAIRYERQILSMMDSPFIIKLHATFKDEAHLYFLFEPLLGGELHKHMVREPARFRDSKVYTFTLACVANALAYLHDRNVLFRDLKPENVLVDASGYMKLCDLGFAKFVLGKTHSLLGTPEYIAPEVIMMVGYDRMVDWWALGVFAYECVCGISPFVEGDIQADARVVFNNIVMTRVQEVEVPRRVQTSTVDFIKSCLQFSPGNRLGSGGGQQVKTHSMFSKIDWADLETGRLRPPFIPKVKSDAEFSKTIRNNRRGTAAPCDNASGSLGEPGWDIDF